MIIDKLTIFGTDNIGIYIFTNDKYTIVPKNLDVETIQKIQETFKTEIIQTTIAKSFLIGIFVAGNNNVILLPRNVDDEEVKKIKDIARDVRVEILDIRPTALGNIILTNSYGALIYPELSSIEFKKIKESLQIDNIEKGSIANIITVGSVGVITDKAGLVHIDTTEEELDKLSKLFRVKIDTGTVNFGSAFIHSGLIANRNGVLVGSATTGPEILRIQRAFSD
ncbi:MULTISPECIES: translation initiation factor IF-6 [Sulfurisphaera]|uniref:Translation initiation factor 6 n=3 Tax=Sulfurisphaera TaxID=69655 RepID=IF6_SULTO|nr:MULTISPECIES: translation initiation factor IF-6 [Sulfurisphaera]Q971I4.1 RecName: Full=Translation initiation factor 6; Short=aIF-6 [Sulfurisphaera tokodaii str. 7]MBB5252467.1 translation initiation factor 6 [Sulfurisphaera ohwakuensis]QGR17082.1 translation initiation factor IF-6 [Sulfurisphaera ohwakuensis]BAB66436.1 translation initiation factor 6 [Sulfurisphaera tokodaii str. 7]HII73749.1 translation initiation factor IF-6 [Sulfurisphaera tokodaii]